MGEVLMGLERGVNTVRTELYLSKLWWLLGGVGSTILFLAGAPLVLLTTAVNEVVCMRLNCRAAVPA